MQVSFQRENTFLRSAQPQDCVCSAFVVIQGVKRNPERNPPRCLHRVCLLVAIWLYGSWKESTQSFARVGNRQRCQVPLRVLPLNILSSKSCIDIFCLLWKHQGNEMLRYGALKSISILLRS